MYIYINYVIDKCDIIKIPCSLVFSWLSSKQGGGAMVSKHIDRNNNTQLIKVTSSRLESDDCVFVSGVNSLPNVRTMASMTEDLFPPATNDFRPRNVNKINTL